MNIDKSISVHVDALRVRAQRTKILASNIANSDTPNYKARDIAFADTLKEAGMNSNSFATRNNSKLKTTHENHISSGNSMSQAKVMYREPHHAALDGNTVDKDAEQARFAENAIRYQASLQFLGNRVNSVIRTLKGE